jgi:uncharacterized membrane protein YhaH (DUF805 family)
MILLGIIVGLIALCFFIGAASLATRRKTARHLHSAWHLQQHRAPYSKEVSEQIGDGSSFRRLRWRDRESERSRSA